MPRPAASISRPGHGSTPARKKPGMKEAVGTLKRLALYFSNSKVGLLLVILMVAASSALALLGPFLVGKAIDEYIVTGDKDGLITLLFMLAAVYAGHSLAVFLQNYWMASIAQKTVYEMRTNVFDHLHKLSLRFFDKRQHGELMSRVTNDMENVSSTLNSSVIQVVSSVLTLVGAVAVMLWLSPLLTAVTLIIVPLMFLGMKWITSRTRPLFKEQQRHLGDLNGYIEEAVSSKHIVKMFSQEERITAGFMERNAKLKEAGFWAQSYSGFIPKLMNVLNNLSFALIAAVGGLFAFNGMITIGVIVIFAEYARQFTRPLNDLANQFNTLLSAIAGAERVFEIMDTEVEEEDTGTFVKLENMKGDIAFEHVDFSYDEGKPILSDITFSASAGEMVALIGPTGSGKTTIVNLLSRFYEPEAGRVLIDDQDSLTLSRQDLRRHMAFVLQDTFLFEGTVMENIRYGRLEATDEEVIEAAKSANADSFINRLPDGYDTLLKSEGSGISQGQKQLLAIARAILADPSILILDEATSSIDTITELHIQEALDGLMKGRTSVVIAHRLNTIQRADQILVLESGRIIERGSHESLKKQGGYYSNMLVKD